MTFSLRLPFGPAATQRPDPSQATPYHAVSVCAGKDACAAAQRFSGKRVLSAEALLLPLADCDRANRCTCHYRHHDDRRERPRRQSEGAPPAGPPVQQAERREKKGRRSEDLEEYHEAESDNVDDSRLVADTYYGYAQKLGSDSSSDPDSTS